MNYDSNKSGGVGGEEGCQQSNDTIRGYNETHLTSSGKYTIYSKTDLKNGHFIGSWQSNSFILADFRE
jgi:hypothetical protein